MPPKRGWGDLLEPDPNWRYAQLSPLAISTANCTASPIGSSRSSASPECDQWWSRGTFREMTNHDRSWVPRAVVANGVLALVRTQLPAS
jgi:hypothetical protein